MILTAPTTIQAVPISPKYASESRILTFDFTALLGSGETLVSITSAPSAIVISGTDPNPGAIISGSSSLTSPYVYQMITGGIAGTIYQVAITVSTSENEVLTGKVVFAVV